MPDPKAYAAKAEAARKQGLAPPALIQEACPGAVFAVNDQAIVLPEERISGNRTIHATRRVIIVQARRLINSLRPCTIAVVPCSASQQRAAGTWDLLLEQDEQGFDAPNVVAYVSLLQPILKSDLVKCYGFIRETTLFTIQRMIAENLGMIPSSRINLPPRDKASKSDDVSTPVEHATVQFRSTPEPE